MPERPSNGWNEWSRYVLKELERLNHNYEQLDGRISKIQVDIGMLKVKAGVWGALAGGIPSIIAIVITLLLR